MAGGTFKDSAKSRIKARMERKTVCERVQPARLCSSLVSSYKEENMATLSELLPRNVTRSSFSTKDLYEELKLSARSNYRNSRGNYQSDEEESEREDENSERAVRGSEEEEEGNEAEDRDKVKYNVSDNTSSESDDDDTNYCTKHGDVEPSNEGTDSINCFGGVVCIKTENNNDSSERSPSNSKYERKMARKKTYKRVLPPEESEDENWETNCSEAFNNANKHKHVHRIKTEPKPSSSTSEDDEDEIMIVKIEKEEEPESNPAAPSGSRGNPIDLELANFPVKEEPQTSESAKSTAANQELLKEREDLLRQKEEVLRFQEDLLRQKQEIAEQQRLLNEKNEKLLKQELRRERDRREELERREKERRVSAQSQTQRWGRHEGQRQRLERRRKFREDFERREKERLENEKRERGRKETERRERECKKEIERRGKQCQELEKRVKEKEKAEAVAKKRLEQEKRERERLQLYLLERGRLERERLEKQRVDKEELREGQQKAALAAQISNANSAGLQGSILGSGPYVYSGVNIPLVGVFPNGYSFPQNSNNFNYYNNGGLSLPQNGKCFIPVMSCEGKNINLDLYFLIVNLLHTTFQGHEGFHYVEIPFEESIWAKVHFYSMGYAIKSYNSVKGQQIYMDAHNKFWPCYPQVEA